MGLDKKREALLSLDSDLLVVPECSEKSVTALGQLGFNTLWFGSHPKKGLGVISRHEWPMRALPLPEQKWIVPIEVDSPTPFKLIAIWACKIGARREDRYIGQVYRAFMAHPEWFHCGPVIIAGDFNSNKIWDFKRGIGNHSDVVTFLSERGLVSAYHETFGESHGTETCPTFYLYRQRARPYHIDYVFIPQEWTVRLRAVEVGGYDRWSGRSDHCPIVLEIC